MFRMAIRKPVTTLMVLIMVLIIGIVGLSGLKMDLMPNVDIPIAIVNTTYVGAAPSEIETLVTKPLEETLSTISNVDTITSTSMENASIVVVQFVDGVNLDMATLDMREKIDLVKPTLPDDASDPMVLKIDMSMLSTIMVGISSNTLNLDELTTLMDDELTGKFEKIEGIASATMMGGLKDEIQIIVNQEKAAGYGISVSQISQILAAENINYPAGTISQGDTKLQIRSEGEFKSVDEIRNVLLTSPMGAAVKVGDIADVSLVRAEATSFSTINGKDGIILALSKESDANIVNVSDRINSLIEDLKVTNPDINAVILMDTSSYIKNSVTNVVTTAFSAAILAIIVLFIFLKDYKTSLIIGVSIPTSVIATFAMMYVMGMTMNILSLSGIAIGIGMFVDNSIVVLENIHRFFEMGHSPQESAEKGTKEVAASITASTLTTVAVFIPMMFLKGTAGQMFKDLSITVTFSLMASLIVSMTFVPMACAKILKNGGKKESGKSVGFLDKWTAGIDNLEKNYRKLLKRALTHRRKTGIIILVIFIATLSLLTTMDMEFVPSMDQGQVTINVTMPNGTFLEETEAMTDEIVSRTVDIPEIKSYYVMSGGGTMSLLTGGSTGEASVNIELVPVRERSRSCEEIADEIKGKVKDIPGAEIKVEAITSAMGSFGSTGIELELRGDSDQKLREISNDLIMQISKLEGVTSVDSSAEDVVPQATIKVDRNKAGMYGLTATSVAAAIRTAVTGSTVTQYKLNGSEIDVVIKYDEDSVKYINQLGKITVTTLTGAQIPVTELAEVTIEDSSTTIARTNMKNSITITTEFKDKGNNEMTTAITEIVENYGLPDGYSYKFTGMIESMTDSFSSMIIVLGISIVLVYVIIASQFESFVDPFVVLFSVPLALTGGILGLVICRQNMSVPAMMGFIMLVGMVVNNAIVLIDYTKQIKNEEHLTAKEALMKSAPTRLRPILMTTLTTVLGLIPMALAIGEGTEMQKPMAIAVIFGMMISTMVTLIFVPILYSKIDESMEKRRQRRARKQRLLEEKL
ncbi:MAG: efflux RND transporter permease subunit [Firmicutes bacterium]|nr:efflux RND transporter permease subunit [Bacillota bacterium]